MPPWAHRSPIPHAKKRFWGAKTLLLGALLMAASVAISYLLWSLLFRLTGRPPEVVVSVLSGMAALFFLAKGAQAYLLGKRHIEAQLKRYGAMERRRFVALDETMEAMNRMAHGDFSVLVTVDDAGPFKELAETVNRMAKELGSMEEVRQEFISNVSHEIQSPLTSISGFAALLRNDDLPKEQRAHYLDIIETESKRLSGISDNLLKLSALEGKTQPPAKAPFSLTGQLEHTLLMLEPQWTAKHLSMELSLERITLSGDEDLLSQVWINLLHNAVKFTHEGGGITVTLSAQEGQAIARIADTGPGIAPEDLMHVFERFYKADKARDRSLGGNGLGLPLVKTIVELHGGQITVDSQPGQGTVFAVTLPGVLQSGSQKGLQWS